MTKFTYLFIWLLLGTFNSMAQYTTIWKTDHVGSSAANQITIPASGSNYTIHWEEVDNPTNHGTTTASDYYTLTLPTPGVYQIQITKGNGSFNAITFNNEGDILKLLEITRWGDTPWSSMENAYTGCANLTVSATDLPNLQQVSSMAWMFSSCTSLQTVPNVDQWNVSRVSNLTGMFYKASRFNASLSSWNVENVTNMSYLFGDATNFNQSIANWNVAKVTNMSAMFYQASTFNQPLGNWNVSKVTDMSFMFSAATAFDQPLDNWNVGNVTNMGAMFYQARAFNQSIEKWNVSQVTNMTNLFRAASAFNQPLNPWKVGNVTSMENMFYQATAFNKSIGDWDVSKVTNMSNMFFQATEFNQNIQNWDVSQVTDMHFMFSAATAFNQPVSSWNVGNVTNMASMFYAASSFNQSFGNWNLSRVTDMNAMLNASGIDCYNLSATLQGFASNEQTPQYIKFGAAQKDYGSQASKALNTLKTNKSWNIIIGNETGCSALEASLADFLVRPELRKVKLNWTTTSETNHDYFVVERSTDVQEWFPLTKVKGSGSSTTLQRYAETDSQPLLGTSYYRLKIVDLVGNTEYSAIRTTHMALSQDQYISPNPATSSIFLSGIPKGVLMIYNITGQPMLQTHVSSEKTKIDNHKLPAGIYTIKMNNGWNTRFMKN